MTTDNRKPRWFYYPGWIALSAISGPLAWWILSSILGWAVTVLVTGTKLSNTMDRLAVVLLPPTTSSVALWFLLDKLPGRTPVPQD